MAGVCRNSERGQATGLNRSNVVKGGQAKRRGAENAEGRRDFFIPKQPPNSADGQLIFSSAFLCVLRVSAFIGFFSTAWIRLNPVCIPPRPRIKTQPSEDEDEDEKEEDC